MIDANTLKSLREHGWLSLAAEIEGLLRKLSSCQEAMSRCLLNDPPGDCYAAEVVELRSKLSRVEEEAQATLDALREHECEIDDLRSRLSTFQKGLAEIAATSSIDDGGLTCRSIAQEALSVGEAVAGLEAVAATMSEHCSVCGAPEEHFSGESCVGYLLTKLRSIERQAEDATEYVLAQINADLRRQLDACEQRIREQAAEIESLRTLRVTQERDSYALKLRSVEEELVEANQRCHDLIRGGEKILAERDSYALRLVACEDVLRRLLALHDKHTLSPLHGYGRILAASGDLDALFNDVRKLVGARAVENQCPGTIDGNHVPTPGSHLCALCRQPIARNTPTLGAAPERQKPEV